MKLTDLQKEWEKDAVIDSSRIGEESIKIPLLHSKYINYLNDSKKYLLSYEEKYLNLKRNKIRYYKGEMGKSELEELGWNQYQGRNLLKTELAEVIDLDADMIKVKEKIEYYKIVISFLESVIKSLASRTFDIRNHIEYKKFMNGVI